MKGTQGRLRTLARALAFVATVVLGVSAGILLAAGAEAEEKLKPWKRHIASRGADLT
jgi:hypothetical protein